MRRIFPHPFVSLFITLMWLLLSGLTAGQLVLGLAVSVIAGQGMMRLRPEKVQIHNWHLFPKLFLRVLVDITRSNLAVAFFVLSGRSTNSRRDFLHVSLDLQNRHGLAVLACILTATPGTVWIAYDSRKSELLLHVLNLRDEAYWRNLIRSRYESLLMEIFE